MRRDFKGEEMVEFRLEVMEFTKQFGVKATKKAFGVSKSTT